MEALTGVQIYWYTSVGLIVGFLIGIFIKKEGVSLRGNLFWGVVGANIMGYIGVQFGLSDGVWFAFIATWPFLFLINAFHQHHIEDVLGEMDHPAHIILNLKRPPKKAG
jgi:uncharacterized membrane protein YeaQ/YmgE (transglycosylase-associated protein family)